MVQAHTSVRLNRFIATKGQEPGARGSQELINSDPALQKLGFLSLFFVLENQNINLGALFEKKKLKPQYIRCPNFCLCTLACLQSFTWRSHFIWREIGAQGLNYHLPSMGNDTEAQKEHYFLKVT